MEIKEKVFTEGVENTATKEDNNVFNPLKGFQTMFILRRKIYSGYSEISPQNVGYQSAQVTSKYVLDPIEKTMDYIENTPLGNSESTKNKLGRFKRAIKPWNDYIKYRKDKEFRELKKIEKRNKKIKR